jgi:hypothetical protein
MKIGRSRVPNAIFLAQAKDEFGSSTVRFWPQFLEVNLRRTPSCPTGRSGCKFEGSGSKALKSLCLSSLNLPRGKSDPLTSKSCLTYGKQ